MNFSELFNQSDQLCRFSPDGQYLANVVSYRLIIRDAKTLQIVHMFTCLDAVQYIEWSPDSLFILCAMYKRNLIQVWWLEEPEWKCKIDEGSIGLLSVRWAPDGRHILSTAEFHLRITIWSLTSKSVSYIKYPKDCQHGIDFTEDRKYLALAERRNLKDHISIFTCNTWQLVKHFECDTDDLAGVKWSPDSRALCVWESSVQYKVCFYSLDGRCLSVYKPDDSALGIKSVAWSPSSQFVAIGGFDQKVVLLNHITWRPITEWQHPAVVNGLDSTVYQETVTKPQVALDQLEDLSTASLYKTQSKYEVQNGNVQVPCIKADLTKAVPRIGVGLMAFSPDNRYLVTRNDNMPKAVWIWDIVRMKQSVLMIQESHVECIVWDPRQARLALSTGSNKIYMWSPAGCLAVEVPCEGAFPVHQMRWHPDGNALLLLGKGQMCVCYFSDENQEADLGTP